MMLNPLLLRFFPPRLVPPCPGAADPLAAPSFQLRASPGFELWTCCWEPGCFSDINAFPLPFPRSESSLARFAHRLSVKQKQEKRRKAEYASAELSAFRPRSLSIEW